MSHSAPRVNFDVGVPERNSSLLEDSEIHMTDREVQDALVRQIQGAKDALKRKQTECQ